MMIRSRPWEVYLTDTQSEFTERYTSNEITVLLQINVANILLCTNISCIHLICVVGSRNLFCWLITYSILISITLLQYCYKCLQYCYKCLQYCYKCCGCFRFCHLPKEDERHPMNQNILINHGKLSSVTFSVPFIVNILLSTII